MTRPVFFRTQEPVSLLGLNAWLASRSDSTAAAELASSHLVAAPPPSLPSSSSSSSRSEAVLAGAAPTSSFYPSSHPAVPPAARAEPPPPLPFQKLASLIASGRVDEIPVMDIEEKVVEVGVVSHTRRQMYSRGTRELMLSIQTSGAQGCGDTSAEEEALGARLEWDLLIVRKRRAR